jgi:hypothetical protein
MNSFSTIILLAMGLLVAGSMPLQARLGESGDELQKRFGPPIKQLKQPGQGDLVQHQYLNHDVLIYVTLFKKSSVMEHYLKLKSAPANGEELVIVPLPKELAAAILQASAEGAKWQELGETDKDIKFARDDKKALAVILKKDKVMVELRVCDINFVEALAVPQKN